MIDLNMELPQWSINSLIKKNSAVRALSETLQEFISYYVLLIFLVNIYGLFI